MKKKFSVYYTYGKNSGEELRYAYIAEDTPERRQKLWDEENDGETYESEEDFVNGIINDAYFHLDGGDYDDPTGIYIIVKSYEEELAELENKIKELKEEFGVK